MDALGSPRDRVTFVGGLAVLGAAAFLAVMEIFRPESSLGHDLGAYLGAARRLMATGSPYDYDPATLALGPYGQYLYPPPVALLFVPLAGLPVQAAAGIWLGLLSAIALGFLLDLVRAIAHPYRSWATGLSIVYLPLLWDVRLGNTALLALALCWAAWRLRERPPLAGALFAGAIGIKLLPVTMLIFLVAAGRWRIAAWIALSGAVVVALTWPLVGAAWGDYMALLAAIAGSQPGAGSNILPEAFGTGPAKALLPLASIALAGGAGWAARRSRMDTYWFCVALAAAPFLSATVWYPYLTLVLPLLMFVTATRRISTGELQPGRGDLGVFGLAWLALQYQAIQQPTRDFTLPFYGAAGLIVLAVTKRIVTRLRAPH